MALPAGTWWSRVAVGNGLEYRLATGRAPWYGSGFAGRSLAGEEPTGRYIDGGLYRAAAFRSDVEGYLWVGPAASAPHWDLQGVSEPTERGAGPPRMSACATV